MRGTSLTLLLCGLSLAGCAAEISDKDRQSSRIQYDTGVDYLGKGNIQSALHAFAESEHYDNSFPDTQNALGLTYMTLGNYVTALDHFQKAIKLRPTWSDIHNNIGTVYLIQGKYDEAIAEFKIPLADVLYATPSNAEGNLGYALYKKGDRDQALKHLKNATLVNPKFCRGYMWLGEVYQAGGEWTDAERYLDRFVDRCLNDPQVKANVDSGALSEVYLRLGQIEVSEGNPTKAKTAFESCVAAGSDTPSYDSCEGGLKQLK